jgi:hypothetical protein
MTDPYKSVGVVCTDHVIRYGITYTAVSYHFACLLCDFLRKIVADESRARSVYIPAYARCMILGSSKIVTEIIRVVREYLRYDLWYLCPQPVARLCEQVSISRKIGKYNQMGRKTRNSLAVVLNFHKNLCAEERRGATNPVISSVHPRLWIAFASLAYEWLQLKMEAAIWPRGLRLALRITL